ncbi:MAG TPA: hypothetical protein VMT57_04840 [Candidatus Thermoplasmatota archaeon]|nr:hypothetical protein [Candidatus Thermoplasmatota archaeon]
MMKKKSIKVSILVVMILLIFPVSVASAEPILEITSITGGFGVHATIKNAGNMTPNTINWTINIKGVHVLFPPAGTKTGHFNGIAPGENHTISTWAFGFGPVNVTVTVTGSSPSVNPPPTNPPAGHLTKIIFFWVLPN